MPRSLSAMWDFAFPDCLLKCDFTPSLGQLCEGGKVDVFNPFSELSGSQPRDVGTYARRHLGLDADAGTVGSRTKLSPVWPFLIQHRAVTHAGHAWANLCAWENGTVW